METRWASGLAGVDLAALSWVAALGWMVGASRMVAGHWDLVENSNEEMGFGEESWEEISGDTLGDVGEQRMTTLGSWMAWRSLAR